MNWETLKEKVYYTDGSYREIYIRHASRDDWKKWAELINDSYHNFFHTYEYNSIANKIDFEMMVDYWDGNYYLISAAYIFIDHIQMNAHFGDEVIIQKVFDPVSVNSVEDHDRIVGFMKALSEKLDKEVILSPENSSHNNLITVHRDKVEIPVLD